MSWFRSDPNELKKLLDEIADPRWGEPSEDERKERDLEREVASYNARLTWSDMNMLRAMGVNPWK